jgi:hypothetical protein
MPTTTDVLRAKTDVELKFFVENPGYYHANLVAAAQQELHRRGLAPMPAATSSYHDDLGQGRQPLAGAGGAYLWASQPAAQPLAASRTRRLSPDSLKLESVVARPIPNFDIDKLVAEQVASIPTSEKRQPQELRQFKGLCHRFWAAETQTEFLTSQAHAGQAGPMFAEQAMVARETWRNWNKAVVYSYHFGPQMQAQLQHMASTASSQQHILANFPGLLNGRKFLTDKEMLAREAETQDWLASLRRVSPVTGTPYRVTVMKMKM